MHLGGDQARPDGVDADALGADLLGQRQVEAVDRALRRRVGGASTQPAQPRGDRGHVDDDAALAAVRGRHPPDRLARAEVDAEHVGPEQVGHVVPVHRVDPEVGQHPGIVDQAVEMTEGLVQAREHAHHLIELADVGQ